MAEPEVEERVRTVPDTEQNVAICKKFCGTCPSHDQCKADEFLFCSRGNSINSDDITQKGCNCPECEVWINYGLSSMYYCISGAAE